MGFGLSGISETVVVRDLNEQGVYLFSDFPLGIRTTVDIYMNLPPEITGNGVRQMHYVASVVRVEENAGNGQVGIALVIKHCEVVSSTRRRNPGRNALIPRAARSHASRRLSGKRPARARGENGSQRLAPDRKKSVVDVVADMLRAFSDPKFQFHRMNFRMATCSICTREM
jgi:hypothetical protein